MQKYLAEADERPPVIVFTCGRTGSTLLIRMLNCLPRTIVWGEHNGALRPLLSSYARLRTVADNKFVARAANLLQPVYDREPILSGQGMSIEWLNWFSTADVDRLYRELITGLFHPDSAKQRFSRWGFKEIQYRDGELGLLRMLFPAMRTIILYRNPAAVLASQFRNFAKHDGERMPKIQRNVEGFFQFAAQQAERKDQADNPPLFISYEEIVGAFAHSVLKLQDFLEEEFTDSIEEIERDIDRFGKRRRSISWSGNPLEDFETWQSAMDVKLALRTIRRVAEYYDLIVTANTEVLRAEA